MASHLSARDSVTAEIRDPFTRYEEPAPIQGEPGAGHARSHRIANDREGPRRPMCVEWPARVARGAKTL
ncbi:MAG: DUF1360 domain-containing protein [Actinomycetota bacterium]|nr:DUF1360 domain-containing protein [Actinomycetota bacterium]